MKNTNSAKFIAGALALALIANACGVFGYGAVDIAEIERTGPTTASGPSPTPPAESPASSPLAWW